MTTDRPRRSPAAVALDAVGALGPGRLLPGAVVLGGLSLAARGPLVGDPYATATGPRDRPEQAAQQRSILRAGGVAGARTALNATCLRPPPGDGRCTGARAASLA